MGKTFSTGLLTNGLWQDASNNIGIGGSPSGSYKFEVTGTGAIAGALSLTGATNKPLRIDSANGNAAYVGSYQNQTILSANRNPSTGAFTDTSKAAAYITLNANAGDGNIVFATTATNNIEPTTRMTILSSGNVGINTSNPSAKLHVDGNQYVTNGTIFCDTFSSYSGGSTNTSINFGGSGSLLFNQGSTERMRITSGGGVYVGCTSGLNANTNYQFQASQFSGGVGVLAVYNSANFTDAPAIVCYKQSSDTSSNNRFIQFYSNGQNQPQGGIVGNGANNAQFGSISDVREKENITDINGSLEKILALRPVSFDWKKTKEHITAGFIAQEVEEIFPEYVVNNMANEGEEERKGLTGGMTGGIISHLVKAIQELSAKVEALENK
jgi:hypothetical protein